MSDDGKKLSKAIDDPLTSNRDPNKKEWVKFEEEDVETGATPTPKVFFFILLVLFTQISYKIPMSHRNETNLSESVINYRIIQSCLDFFSLHSSLHSPN